MIESFIGDTLHPTRKTLLLPASRPGDGEAGKACTRVGHMSSFVAMFLGGQNTPKGLAVADVIWCGECQP